MNSTRPIGLVLSGGGARGAYQVGVLLGLADILRGTAFEETPFQVLTGVSAGAINAAFLASGKDFREATKRLADVWSNLRSEQVIRTDLVSLGKRGVSVLKDLSLGGMIGRSQFTHLLDSSPLRALLGEGIDFGAIRESLARGKFRGLAVSGTNYRTGTAVTFYDGAQDIEPWVRSSRIGIRSEITLDHILASAAIPFFFEPIRLGCTFYGDGGVRLNSPLSPAIHLGATRLFGVGIRYPRALDQTVELNATLEMPEITMADISGVILNAIFLDSMDSDVERLLRINETLHLISEEDRQNHPRGLRPIPILMMQPSQDLGTLAADQFERFPMILRYLLKGLGASSAKGWDLLSYLAFDQAYTRQLVELGLRDAQARSKEILEFFLEGESK